MTNITNLLGKIHNCDCLEFMKQLPDKCVDLVLTDPPYGIERFKAKDGGNSKKITSFGDRDTAWNHTKPVDDCFAEIFRISKKQIIFGMNNFNLPPTEYFIVWDKGQKMPSFAECELAWTNIRIPAKIIRNGFECDKEHPAQKPFDLWVKIFNRYAEGCDIIFDPFMGSGTTAVACERLGRKWFGCELEPKYVEIAEKRIEAERAQLKLF